MNTNNSALIVPPPAPTAAAATNDIRDIKPPLHIPEVWFWVMTILFALVAAALAYWLWRIWSKRRALTPPARIIPPHERALRMLADALPMIHDANVFCTRVSRILRVYLEERFRFHAPERTTEEFLYELQETTLLSPAQKGALADFLTRCDLVKFARFEPTQVELQDLYDAAVRLVVETEPRPVAPGASLQQTQGEQNLSVTSDERKV
jgi:hypothetical protein